MTQPINVFSCTFLGFEDLGNVTAQDFFQLKPDLYF